ncbi:MAG: Gfo/Idh/MocA family oxidoreductase [Isosphaeraceae bacterium]
MTSLSRRDFLAASALAAGTFGRARADDQPKKAGANDSVVLGFIGIGGMGSGLLNIMKTFPDVRVAAVCDVYEPHTMRAKEAAGGKPDTYGDFRKVLDRKDIDAVVIATPDHWHALATIHACQAGKDVYCEKPLTYSIAEGRAVVNAANKYKRVTQMGNLIHASESYHRMAEIVQSGVLGQITKARVWMASNSEGLGNPANTAPPEGCDYDFWLGPAPKRDFNSNRFLFTWRYFWDYAGGQLTDFVCHLVDPVHWGMQVDAPETITATGGRYALKDNAETPDTLEVAYHYAKGFDLVWSHISNNAHGFEGRGAGIEFQGTNGTLHGHYNDFKIIPEKGVEIVLPEPTLPRSVGHHREWIDAIKSRDQCSCHFEYGHRLSTVGNLGNIALRTGEKLHWDSKAERITNHAEANQFLERAEYRAPWTLPKI